MFGRLFHKCGVAVLLSFGFWGLLLVSPANSQTPSDVDTIRVLDNAGLPGDTVTIELYLHNSFTVGGYSFRLSYPYGLLEPLTDRVLIGGFDYRQVRAEQLRGAAFETFSCLDNFGEIKITALDNRYVPDTALTSGSGVVVRMKWRVSPGAIPQSTAIFIENDPYHPQSWNTMSDLTGTQKVRPAFTPGTFTINAGPCSWQGDPNRNGVAYEIGDLVFLIKYAFGGGAVPQKDPTCARVNRGEITCDDVVDVFDVVKMSDIIGGMRQPDIGGCQ